MYNLQDLEWKPFKISDLFNVSKGAYLNKKDISKGETPYITAKSSANGINGFIGTPPSFGGDAITIEKVRFSPFYQPKDFYCSHDVTVIRNEHLNMRNALFINSMLSRQSSKYSYGRQAQMNVVKRETIFLPVKAGEPDWQFMGAYSQCIIKKKEAKYTDYIQARFKGLEYKDVEELTNRQWAEFFIKDLFVNIKRGKRLTKSSQSSGLVPYVSSTASFNGVDTFISNTTGVRRYKDCITIANSGSVGASFYHPYEFVASDHVTHLENKKYNKYIYMFIATLCKRLSSKYNFNRELNDKRISREKIMLPVSEVGEPDFAYMEQFMKNIEYKKISSYLSHKGAEI